MKRRAGVYDAVGRRSSNFILDKPLWNIVVATVQKHLQLDNFSPRQKIDCFDQIVVCPI
jgi:hypothetical protein